MKSKLVVLMIVVLIAALLSGCERSPEVEKNNPSGTVVIDYAEDYEVVSGDESSGYEVVIQAPDFATILTERAIDLNEDFNEAITAAVSEHPDSQKEYILQVDDLADEKVQEAFLDQVAFDLMVQAITHTDSEGQGGEQP